MSTNPPRPQAAPESSTRREPLFEDDEPTAHGEDSLSLATSPDIKALWATPDRSPDALGRNVLHSVSLTSWRQYRDLRLLGEGGMGRIFRAFDPSLKRTVALKFLRRGAQDLVARFVLEAQHQAMVDHPNVCKVYEVGDWQGQSYIAMQFINGRTLDAARDDLSLMEKVEVMETVTEAMHAAHRQGLIHRDIKPANILVERLEDKGWKPYILDFGLARQLDSAGLTEHGFVFGTTHFMAPEQATGDVDRVGRRTDVYALGATLYKLLCGEAVFPGKDAMDCMRRTVDEEPAPLRKRAPEVPPDLETIVMKCLEKEPERRYESARALAEDLRRFREGEPILAYPPTLLYRTGKLVQKHRTLVYVSAAALVIALTFAAIGLQARLTASERAQWAQHFGQQAEQIEALIRYTHLLPIHDIRPELAQVREKLQSMEQDAAKSGRVAGGPAAYALGRGHLALGEPAKAKEFLERAWTLGFQTPEVSYALGRAYGALYQQELERARRITEPEVRDSKIREIEKTFRDPSILRLRAGGQISLEPPSYRDALLAFYDQKYDEALTKSREAFHAKPWFYEALRLEGDILLAKAGTMTQPKESQALLEEAVQRFWRAQQVAPSDAALLLGEARCWRQQLDQGWWQGEFPQEALKSGLDACARAEKINPDMPDVYALQAWLQVALIRHKSSKGQEIEPFIQVAKALTEKALTLNPEHLESLVVQVSVESLWAKQLWFFGKDPLEAWKRCFLAGDKALSIDPNDIALVTDLSRAYLQCMDFKSRKGADYRNEWQASAALMERATRALPNADQLQETFGAVYVEWGEQEQSRGRDPSQALDMAIKTLERARQLNPSSPRTHYYLGCAHLILGNFHFCKGGNPLPFLERALQSQEAALRIKADYRSALSDQAQCHLLKAKYLIRVGDNPESQMRAARMSLERIRVECSELDFASHLRLAECGMLEVEWLLQQPSTKQIEITRTDALLAQSELEIRASIRKNSDRDSWIALAKLFELRGRSSGLSAMSYFAKGLQAAQRAIEADPQYGESYYYLGLLETRRSQYEQRPTERAKCLRSAKEALAKAVLLNPLLKAPVELAPNRKRLSGWS